MQPRLSTVVMNMQPTTEHLTADILHVVLPLEDGDTSDVWLPVPQTRAFAYPASIMIVPQLHLYDFVC
jgi:hypothetical protein